MINPIQTNENLRNPNNSQTAIASKIIDNSSTHTQTEWYTESPTEGIQYKVSNVMVKMMHINWVVEKIGMTRQALRQIINATSRRFAVSVQAQADNMTLVYDQRASNGLAERCWIYQLGDLMGCLPRKLKFLDGGTS